MLVRLHPPAQFHQPIQRVHLGADQRAGWAFRFGGQPGAKVFRHGVQICCAARGNFSKAFGIVGHGSFPIRLPARKHNRAGQYHV